MSVSLRHLCADNDNPFRLEVCAGENGSTNIVNWIYMLEDEYIIPYFHGSELIVTTGRRQSEQPDWLLEIVQSLYERHAAGLIVNVGMYVFEIPQPVLDFCNEKDFPLLTMPWEIHITEMIQTLCVTIMNKRQESLIHDQAIRDAILKHNNPEIYQDILSTYYDLDADFLVIAICSRFKKGSQPNSEGDFDLPSSMDYWLETRLRRMKRRMGNSQLHIGIVTVENLQLIILNHSTPELSEHVLDVIVDAYKEVLVTHDIYIGVGQLVTGIKEMYKSFQRATTAMKMAVHQNKTVIDFNEMGFDRLLFSITDEEVLSSYADEILGAVEQADAQGHEYMKLLRAYIRNDRSLDGTARELYIHRNTVNYQLQKLRKLLNSPLKTAEDLFPIQAALAIRDM
ncbi:MAG: PucR family transcriptional regulator ligand-binding domain-containing protein [Lachnospiraceae bacterium]|nr:PucR family transcriptional regulator ligand-binding domain-containing protein [Lachnospiraceae bacterium]